MDKLHLNLRTWEGRGPAILLTHGMAANTHWWDTTAPLLAAALSPVALDFSGHGDSDWRPDGRYGSDIWTGDIESARQALGLERMILCGHSLGARVALDYAARHPNRLQALILVDFLPEAYATRSRKFERTRARPQPRYPDKKSMTERFRLQPPGTLLGPESLAALALQSLRADGDAYTWKFDWRAFANRYEPVWPILAAIRTPTLVVRGERSLVIDRPSFERVVRSIGGARGLEIARAYHHVPLDCPRELSAAILSLAEGL